MIGVKRQTAKYVICDYVMSNIAWLLFNIVRFYMPIVASGYIALDDFLLSRNYTAKPGEITPPNTADFSSIFGFLSLVSAGFFTIFAVKKSKKKVINEN